MSEEQNTTPEGIEYQFHCTQKDHTSIKRKSFLWGTGTGGGIVAVIALLLKTCNGDYTSISNQNADADVTYVGDAGVPKCSDIKGCYDKKQVSQLQEKIDKCDNYLGKHEGNLYKEQLEKCLEEKDELSKHECPTVIPTVTYTPKSCPVCPAVNECPKTPYLRKGD